MSGRTALGDKAVRPWWLGRTAIGFLNGNERIALSLIVQNEHNVYRVAPNSISRLQFLKYGFHMSLCHIKDILGVVLRSVSITIVQSIIQFKFRTCMMPVICQKVPFSTIIDHYLPLSTKMWKMSFACVVYLHRDLPEAFSVRFSFDVR